MKQHVPRLGLSNSLSQRACVAFDTCQSLSGACTTGMPNVFPILVGMTRHKIHVESTFTITSSFQHTDKVPISADASPQKHVQFIRNWVPKHPKLCKSVQSTKHSEQSNSLDKRPEQTLNRTRNLEVTGSDDNAFAFDAEAHTNEHMRLAVQDDYEKNQRRS